MLQRKLMPVLHEDPAQQLSFESSVVNTFPGLETKVSEHSPSGWVTFKLHSPWSLPHTRKTFSQTKQCLFWIIYYWYYYSTLLFYYIYMLLLFVLAKQGECSMICTHPKLFSTCLGKWASANCQPCIWGLHTLCALRGLYTDLKFDHGSERIISDYNTSEI